MNREYARKLDSRDPLAGYKEEFYLPEHLYYEANGLGPMSRRSEKTLKGLQRNGRPSLWPGGSAEGSRGFIILSGSRLWSRSWPEPMNVSW